jgi:hypothetical protein
MPSPATSITARGTVPAAPAEVFAVLGDLDRHRDRVGAAPVEGRDRPAQTGQHDLLRPQARLEGFEPRPG